MKTPLDPFPPSDAKPGDTHGILTLCADGVWRDKTTMPLRIGRHRMAHATSPTWCVACGTFDVWCGVTACKPVVKSKRWWTR